MTIDRLLLIVLVFVFTGTFVSCSIPLLPDMSSETKTAESTVIEQFCREREMQRLPDVVIVQQVCMIKRKR